MLFAMKAGKFCCKLCWRFSLLSIDKLLIRHLNFHLLIFHSSMICYSERALLNRLMIELHKLDSDVLVGHNISGFDLDVLLHRVQVLFMHPFAYAF